MSSDRDISIHIKTTADTSGAKDAADALKKVGDASNPSSNPMLKNDGQIQAEIEATKQAEEAAQKHEEALKKAAEAAAELKDELAKIEQELQGVSDTGEDANKQASDLEKNVEGISRAQKGQIVAQLAQGVGKIADKFREAASEVQEFDKEAAAGMRQTADRIDGVTTAVSSLALGFAAGGPLGAGLAAVGLGIGALVSGFKDAEVAAIKVAAVGKEGLAETAKAARETASAAQKLKEEMASDAIAAAIQRQNEKLEDGLNLLRERLNLARQFRREQEEVLQAEDKLKLAEIDQSEAKGSITSVQAEKQRQDVGVGAKKRADDERKNAANEDAGIARKEAEMQAQDYTRRERDLEEAKARLAEKEKEIEAAKRVVSGTQRKKELDQLEKLDFETTDSNFSTAGQTQAVRNKKTAKEEQIAREGYTIKEQLTDPEKAKSDLKAAEDAARQAREQVKRVQEEVERQAKVAGSAAITADTKQQSASSVSSTVDKRSQVDQKTREVQNQTAEIRARKEAEEKRNNEQKKEQERAAREAENQSRKEAGIGRSAASLIPKGAPERLKRAINTAAEKRQDGDQGGEILKLVSMMEEMAKYIRLKDSKTKIDLSNLQEQIKNLRAP